MFNVKTFGTLSYLSELQYQKRISISYDTLEYDKNSDIKILVQLEPPPVIDMIQDILKNAEKFDLILAWNKDLLHLPNVEKFILGCCWIDWNTFTPNKMKHVSFITSNKAYAPGHQMRLCIWEGLKDAENLNGFEILKHKSPPMVLNKNFLFETSKYSIVVENDKRDNWITEKIIDCFASKTIPIYWGCPNISDYFNINGIITFDTLEELEQILNNLDESYYNNCIDIIEENFELSKFYWNFQERIKTIVQKYQ